ncbi:MAG: hypothetical protein IPO22_14620 [Anaerolineales bacterium]|nr:hypothetical protein [Anaerolineales bacterium]
MVKIVITVVVCVMLGLAGISAVTDTPMMGMDFVKIIGGGLGNALSAAIAAFGNVVIVFAILERVLPDKEISGSNDEKDWDPASLTSEPDPDSVKRGELIAEIIFTFLGLALLNLYPEILGAFIFTKGEPFFIPMFSDVFFKFMPWINAIFLAEIVLIFTCCAMHCGPISRVAKILIEAASIALTVIILRTPGIVGFTAEIFQELS